MCSRFSPLYSRLVYIARQTCSAGQGELEGKSLTYSAIACRYDQYEDAWDTSVQVEIDGERVGFFHAKKQGVDRGKCGAYTTRSTL